MTHTATTAQRATPQLEVGHPPSWRTVYVDGIAFVGRGVVAGLVSGALVGGVGGRLAMLALRFTSDDTVRGMESDDGFTIGVITGATFFLIVATAMIGALGGLLYLAVRGWLPPHTRAAVFGLIGATVGGALVIQPSGVDFTVLGPRWLAVVLFVALPALYGVTLSVLTERLLHPGGWQRSRWRWVPALPLGLLLLTGPVGFVIVLIIGLLIGTRRSGHAARLWHSRPVTWLGRGAVAVALAGGGVMLARDIAAVL